MTQWTKIVDIILGQICSNFAEEEETEILTQTKAHFGKHILEMTTIERYVFEWFDNLITHNATSSNSQSLINWFEMQKANEHAYAALEILNIDVNDIHNKTYRHIYETYFENVEKNDKYLLNYFKEWIHIHNLEGEIETFIKKAKTQNNFSSDFAKFLQTNYDLSDVVSNYYDISNVIDFIEKNPILLQIAKYFGFSNESTHKKILISDSPENTVGVKTGNDLSIVLPYQLALRNKEIANKIFKIGFIEKKLIQLEQKGQSFVGGDKGPIIILIDTSLSMCLYEILSKAIALVLTKNSIVTKRKCFLINFSTKLEMIDLTDRKNGAVELLKFLSLSLDGGTNMELGLEAVVDVMTSNINFKNSDVIVISDMHISPIPAWTIAKIKNLKSNSNFYGVITRPTETKIHNSIDQIFSEKWYVTDTAESINSFSKKVIERFSKKSTF